MTEISTPPNHQRSAAPYTKAALVFSALGLFGSWVMALSILQWQWKETLDAEMRQNTNTAVAFKEHTLRILDTVDQAALLIQQKMDEKSLTGDALVRIARETGMAPQILTQLSFVDANGIFRGSNLDPDGSRSKNVDLSEREHVRVHLRPDTTSARPMHNGLFISQPLVGKVSGVRTIQLTRKLVGKDGSTLGVAVASLDQQHFTEVYRDVNFGAQGGVVLARLDGQILARVIGGASTDSNPTLPNDITAATRKQRIGALMSTGSDGVQRIIGFSRVGDYDLSMQTGTAVEQSFASWRNLRTTVLLLTLALSLSLVTFVAAFLVSIRRLTRSEAEAQRANQAKSEFLTSMSHELRTPLTSIRGFAELMELRSKEPVVREQSALIRQGAEHLNVLLTDILDLAKIEAGVMTGTLEPVAVHALLDEVTNLFRVSASAKGLSLTVVEGPGIPATLNTDRLKLKQILHNLLSNAIKFTPAGSITLAVEPTADAQHVSFHISDTGPGIAPYSQELIFEKFRQGNARVSYEHGGTGLGLALARELAGLLGGTLTLQSRVGDGSTFTLTLPLA
jgi:signal transduction histidine kinase